MNEMTGTVLAAPAAPGAEAAAASASVLVILVLGFLLHRALDKRQAKWPHLIMAFAMGVLLAGSLFGSAVKDISNSLGSAMIQILTTATVGS